VPKRDKMSQPGRPFGGGGAVAERGARDIPRRMSFRPFALVLALAVAPAACASYPSISVVNGGQTFVENQARITLDSIDGDTFTFTVYNLSNDSLRIERNAFRLRTPDGIVERRSGGLTDSYLVGPHGAHDVKVRFPLEGVHAGDEVSATFSGALMIGGNEVTAPPMPLKVGE
jgi:hypothetical protein